MCRRGWIDGESTEVDDLRDKRNKLGISQAEFARRCKVCSSYICAIEHGKEKPSADMVGKINMVLAGGRVSGDGSKRGRKKFVPFESAEEETDLKRIWRDRHISARPSWAKTRVF